MLAPRPAGTILPPRLSRKPGSLPAGPPGHYRSGKQMSAVAKILEGDSRNGLYVFSITRRKAGQETKLLPLENVAGMGRALTHFCTQKMTWT